MNKKSFFTALLFCMAVLGVKAQNIIIDKNPSKESVKGNGNIITCDYDVAGFDEISIVLPATVNCKSWQ